MTVVTGTAKLLSACRVAVETEDGTQVLEARQIFLNTGSAPVFPPIEGLERHPFAVDSEGLLKQMRFLPREDEEIADAVRANLEGRGVEILTETEVRSVLEADGGAVVTVDHGGEARSIEADTVLVATGRKPNTGGLQFTYISLDDYRIVRSAVRGNGSYTLRTRGAVPYSVFLDPPFSRVGMSEREAVDAGYSVKVVRLPAAAIPKALVVQQLSGLLKAIVDEKTGLILGAHLFCEESQEMINLVKLAMDAKLPYTVVRDMMFTHSTMSEALNDLFNA